MKRYPTLCLLFLLSTIWTFGQEKKPLEHEDFAIWKQIPQQRISNDGAWVAYVLQPGEGNPSLHLYQGSNKQTLSFERANNPRFSADSRYLIFDRKADADLVKALRRKGTKKDKLPGDSVLVYNLSTKAMKTFPGAKAVQVPGKWQDWIFFKEETEVKKDSSDKSSKAEQLVAYSLTEEKAFPLLHGDEHWSR